MMDWTLMTCPKLPSAYGLPTRYAMMCLPVSLPANKLQAAANSCASVAIMNIVMNVPAIKLGEKLTSFKQETRLQKPRYRGAALAANEEIRIVHNSFAR